MLVEVARTHKNAVVTLHQRAQHPHGGLVQVLQLVEKNRVVAALQRRIGLVEIERRQLLCNGIGAVAGHVKQGLVVQARAQALVPHKELVEPVVEIVLAAVGGGAEA